jgi:hypothetical protein
MAAMDDTVLGRNYFYQIPAYAILNEAQDAIVPSGEFNQRDIIRYNQVWDSGYYANIDNFGGGYQNATQIYGNYFHGSHGNAIDNVDVTNVTWDHNVCEGGSTTTGAFSSDFSFVNGTISYNTFNGCFGVAINGYLAPGYNGAASDVHITNNAFIGGSGIQLNASANTVSSQQVVGFDISNNTFSGSSGPEINLTDAASGRIVANRFVGWNAANNGGANAAAILMSGYNLGSKYIITSNNTFEAAAHGNTVYYESSVAGSNFFGHNNIQAATPVFQFQASSIAESNLGYTPTACGGSGSLAYWEVGGTVKSTFDTSGNSWFCGTVQSVAGAFGGVAAASGSSSGDNLRLGDTGSGTTYYKLGRNTATGTLDVTAVQGSSFGLNMTNGFVSGSSYIEGGSGTAPTCTAGDGCFSRSTTTGALNLGGSSSNCVQDYGVTTASTMTIGCSTTVSGTMKATTINGTGLTASADVCTDGSKNLTTSCGSIAVTCGSASSLPCGFTWNCSIAAAGSSCSTTQSVPASSRCNLTLTTPAVVASTGILLDESLSSTTLTINARSIASIAGGDAVTGVGTCL